MYLSISLDRAAGESQADYKARALEIEGLAPDLVLLAREDDGGVLSPPRVEALIDIAWITGILTTPAVAAGLPALHSLPFHVARALSAADFLSAGRAGWIPLVGRSAEFDTGYGASTADDLSDRADDFIRATRALWDSWDDDALVLDKPAGRYLDSSRIRRVAYAGSNFSTMGSLNAARPPQGHPLLVRDIDDRPESGEQADIVIGTSLPDAKPGVLRLMRIVTDPLKAAAAVAGGAADGLHLAGPSTLAMLRELRMTVPAEGNKGATARTRFALPHPVNPFSAKVPA